METQILNEIENERNKDPITGEHGAHPVGVAAGATAGAVAGAVLGAVGGPVGVVAGTAAGAIAGGLAGKAAGEAVNPTIEDGYWRIAYLSREYYSSDLSYEFYQPAYRFGWEAYLLHADRKFEDVEPDLKRDWLNNEASGRLDWDRAKLATRDAWERLAKS